MSGDLDAEVPATPESRPLGPLLGAVLAVAASAGLAWWFGTARDTAPAPAMAPPPAVARPALTAAAQPDEAQVRRAYEAFQDAYADGGADGVAAAKTSCAATLAADPRILDYCLAFDMFAAAVSPGAEPEGLDAGRLAAARGALPSGSDPARRVAEVGRLAKVVALGEAPAAQPVLRPALQPGVRPAPTVRQAAARARPAARAIPSRTVRVRVVSRPKPTRLVRVAARAKDGRAPAAAGPVIDACLFEATAAARLVCANPGLAEADRRMRRAYDEALSSVADRQQVEEDQARWRGQRDRASDPAEVRELYDARTRDLEDLTPPH